MKLESVKDPAFRDYGQIVEGYDFKALLNTLRDKVPCPADGVAYIPGVPALESLPVYKEFQDNYYGGMPIQIGYCSGFNVMLDALEYHRDSEVNVALDDVILLLAKQAEIEVPAWKLDTSRVRAFLLPAGSGVELYAATLHYAPGSVDGKGFRVAVVLPRGTNTDKPVNTPKNEEDTFLTARNKWLFPHPECKSLMAQGFRPGLSGKNIDVRQFWKK